MFLRKECISCKACTDVCPIDALAMKAGVAKVEKDWCIGCGICVNKCPSQAARIVIRLDKKDEKPAGDF
ncbi:MAG: 4Fe-4S binding protein [Candidatus Aminicenantes bacterium]|nr:4Fe-4S binding protein [Candidatus Aminicenantes bacterium]